MQEILGTKRWLVFSLGLALLLTQSLSWAQTDNQKIGYSLALESDVAIHQPSFERVVRSALASLRGYELTQGITVMDPVQLDLVALVGESKNANNQYHAVFRITPTLNKKQVLEAYQATLQVYNTDTGALAMFWDKSYPVDKKFKMQTLISLVSYDLPIQLQRQNQQIAQVINVNGREVQIDFDAMTGVKRGDVLRVFKDGGEIKSADGVVFGKLQETTGIVKVLSVQPFYITAEVLIGNLSIKNGQMVEFVPQTEGELYRGEVMTVHEDQVAINLGSKVGVQPGSYYAVFQDVKAIGDESAFREQVGAVVINEVFENYAKGRFTLSNHHNLSKLMVQEGAVVEEIDAPWSDSIAFSFSSYNIAADSQSSLNLSYVMPSNKQMGITYRVHAGYKDTWMIGGGVLRSLDYSPNFFTGIDVYYFGDEGFGTNLSLSVEPPFDLWRNVKPVIEVGYMIGAEAYTGANFNVGVKYLLK